MSLTLIRESTQDVQYEIPNPNKKIQILGVRNKLWSQTSFGTGALSVVTNKNGSQLVVTDGNRNCKVVTKVIGSILVGGKVKIHFI